MLVRTIIQSIMTTITKETLKDCPIYKDSSFQWSG